MQEKEQMTGYPSIDKPWLKYYSEEAIHASLPEKTLYEYLYESNKNHLQCYALNYFGRKITYKELFLKINIVAKAFLAQGIKPGDVVTVVSVSCVTSILCFYALNRIGAISNYINVLSSPEDMATYFKESKSRIVVTTDLFCEKVIQSAKVVRIKQIITFSLADEMPIAAKLYNQFRQTGSRCLLQKGISIMKWRDFLLTAKGQREIICRKDPFSCCFLAHTGGTTGFPKTVMLSDYGMNAVAHQYKLSLNDVRGQVFLNVMIPFVVYGMLSCMHMPLSLGFCVAIVPKFDSSKWSYYFRTYKPNYLLAVPSYIAPMLNDPKLKNCDMSDFMAAGVGGDGMTTSLETNLNQFFTDHNSSARVLKGYGLTEVGATAIVGFNNSNKIGSIGIPLVKNNVMVYNQETEAECRYGEVGEICLHCPSRMIGYQNNDAETRKLFHMHSDGIEWLHTGDLGYVDEDGFVFLVGRMKRIILTTSQGVAYKVYPHIPEETIAKHPNVKEICLIGVPFGSDMVLRAYIVPKSFLEFDKLKLETELRYLCEKELSVYQRPHDYQFIDRLPLTAAGKVDYRELELLAEKESF